MLKPCLTIGAKEAGCDEAGRGCLSGPVFAAAVIFPEDVKIKELDDSKKLSEAKRDELRPIIEKTALAFAVGIVDQVEIDEINILNASYLAMHRALEKLSLKPEFILVDGNRFRPYQDIPHECIIKGDGIFLSIAAASVLAKTYRDDFMKKLHLQFPEYAWDKNKGYPTSQHRKAIQTYGITPYHRKSFRLTDEQLKIEL
jgi:ribonuclease HII